LWLKQKIKVKEMVFSRLSLSLVPRNVMRNSLRRSHGHEETYKGQNIPFDVSNHRALAIKMAIFYGIPFAVPFIVVRYQLKKSSGQYN